MLIASVALMAGLAGCGGDASSTVTDPATDVATASDSATATPTPETSEEPTDEPSTEPTPTVEPPADLPACAEVWQDGAKMPMRYAGCLDETGGVVKAEKSTCSSGQTFIRYDDRFWAIAGATVYKARGPMVKDERFIASVKRCRG